MRSAGLLLASVLPLLPSVQAQSPNSGPWTIDHVLGQRSLEDVDIGPEGERALWVKETPDPEADKAKSDVYLTYRNDPHGGDSTATVQLIRTGNNEDPRWSPNGYHIAFLSDRKREDAEKETIQIWRLDPRGGAPEAVTSVLGVLPGPAADREGAGALPELPR